MVLAGLFVLSLFIFLVFKNNKLDNEKIIFAALLLQFGLIMLLPRMHERYSYVSDILFIIMIFYNRNFLWYAVSAQLCSFLSYMPFLTGYYTVPLEYLAVARVFLLIWLIYQFAVSLLKSENTKTPQYVQKAID